jgi:NAD(P)-dependent dehydrogenase (short-subunit alcohol dehydrogenase family)
MKGVALITGAGRGIGRATAIELGRSKYQLSLVSRSVRELEETAQRAGGGLVLPADVTRPEQVEAAIKRTIETYGQLDAIIHCAGVAPAKSLEETSIDDWHEVMNSNLSSAFYVAKFGWPHLKASQGVIVLLSSAATRDPFPGFIAYAPAKAGINLLALTLAREGAAHGIRAHAIAPAAVETAMLRKLLTPEQYPTEKTLAPAEVATVIAQCVRGDLRHTSGETIYLQKSS